MAIIKGFIFDLDGVLVDTARYHFEAWQRLAASLGINFSKKDNEQLKGVGRRESLKKILEWGQVKIGEEEFERLMQQKNEWYLESVSQMPSDEILPGTREFLQKSADLNLKIALGSASKNASLILDKTDLTHFFDVQVDGTQTSRSKPDPQVFELGAEALALEPASLVVFEDSQAGIEAARRGGFRAVGIGNKKSLRNAELILKDLAEMSPAEVINKLNF